jgi:hypothetical protein
MASTVVVSSEPSRNKRLRELSLVVPGHADQRWGLLEAVRAAVAGRAGATDNDARSAAGYGAWNSPTRRLREVYREFKGWEKFEENGVEGILNHNLKLRIVVVSTDEGTCDLESSPRNRTPKGPARKSNIDLNNQMSLFGKSLPVIRAGYQTLELCIFDDGNDVRAELSLPVGFEDKRFLQFAERIFLIDPGEWIKIAIDSDENGDDIEPEVRRRK